MFDTVVVVVDICCVGPCVLGKLTLGGFVVVASWVNPSVLGGLHSVEYVPKIISLISIVVIRLGWVEAAFFVDIFVATSFVS